MEKTRSAVKCPLFGDARQFKENFLPTYEDVMKDWEWTRHELKNQMKNPKEPLFSDIAQIVSERIENVWIKASLPTVSHTRVIQMLKSYHLKCKNLIKSLKRLTEERKQIFLTNSRVLFDISSCKCKNIDQCLCPKEKKIPKEEKNFLVDQRTLRQMAIGGLDISHTKTLQKRAQRSFVCQKRSLVCNEELLPVKKPRTSLSAKSSTQETALPSSSTEIHGKTKKTSFPALAKVCDRYGISDRAAAALASSVLYDIGSDVDVIDRHKLRRERQKTRENIIHDRYDSRLSALYFDGRKDRTLTVQKKAGRNYRTTTVEEHISLIKEPESIYLGYVVPSSGTAKSVLAAIMDYTTEKGISLNHLQAVGCDGTNVNTGIHGGIIRLMEKQLNKPLQWIVCLLHMNELPLRHLFLHLDGSTSGPTSYTGRIGKALDNCETQPVVSFELIQADILPLPKVVSDLSTDQLYLHKIVSAVTSGNFPPELAHKSPGKLSHARWLTRANRILRLYVATEAPSENLTILATFVVKVYAPVWFAIKCAPSLEQGARIFFEEVYRSRYLPENLKKIVDVVIQRNGYAAHPENLLLSMLTDKEKEVRQIAVQRIFKARTMIPSVTPRIFKVPKLNMAASSYVELINWDEITITAPPILETLSNDELSTFVEFGGGDEAVFKYPSHSQAVERAVKLTTEASLSLCSKENREGLIKTKLMSRKLMPKFETKRDFNV